MEEKVIQEPEVVQEEIANEKTPEEAFEHNAPDVNLQKMREDKEAAERRTEEASKRAEYAERELERIRALQTQAESVPVKEEEEGLLGEDDLVEVEDYNKVYRKVDEMSKQLREMKLETEETRVNTQLSSEHNDYNQVMTKENIDKLKKDHPELAFTLGKNTEKYSQYKSAYQMIKGVGIYQPQQPNNPQVNNPEKKLINSNLSKPIPSNAIGSKTTGGALTHANMFAGGLTDDVKKELRKRNKLATMSY